MEGPRVVAALECTESLTATGLGCEYAFNQCIMLQVTYAKKVFVALFIVWGDHNVMDCQIATNLKNGIIRAKAQMGE